MAMKETSRQINGIIFTLTHFCSFFFAEKKKQSNRQDLVKPLLICNFQLKFFYFFFIQLNVPFKIISLHRDEPIDRWGET